jgi:hypothetical protein
VGRSRFLDVCTYIAAFNACAGFHRGEAMAAALAACGPVELEYSTAFLSGNLTSPAHAAYEQWFFETSLLILRLVSG